jgi:Na+-driven multidrug efflux pump
MIPTPIAIRIITILFLFLVGFCLAFRAWFGPSLGSSLKEPNTRIDKFFFGIGCVMMTAAAFVFYDFPSP